MDFWAGKRVLVTGGAGLIGSHLVRKLVERGASARVVDDLSKGSLDNLSAVRNKIELRQLDLLNTDACKGLLDGVYACFHLAAKIGGIGYFHKYPATSIRDNSRICMNLWEEARQTSTKMICVSSSMVFEGTQTFPTPETAILTSPPPVTGYGFSKLFGEYLARTYWKEFGVPYVIARPFNAYGPGEESGDYVGYSHVIPDLARKILSGQYPLEILGSGNQTRSYTYVEDVADALAFVAERAENDDFNIGTGLETSVLDVARVIWRLCGRKEEFGIVSVPAFEHDVQRRVPDISKIASLGWRARIPLEQGIAWTIEYLTRKKTRVGG
jgi:nucleoside-diphosphate-sugar epimerase